MIFRTRSGQLLCVEVKSSTTAIAPALSKAQQNTSAFIASRLQRAALGQGQWANADAQTRALAISLRKEIASGTTVKTLKVNITNMFSGSNTSVVQARLW
jgi:NH3-dependent NAD+ synthetase